MIRFQLGQDELIFAVSQTQWHQCRAWQRLMNEQMVRQQLEREQCESIRLSLQQSLECGRPTPHYGAIGGAYYYTFFPTPAGFTLKVTHQLSRDELRVMEEDNPTDAIVVLRICGSAYEQLRGWHPQRADSSLEERLRSQYEYGCCNTTLGQIVKVCHLATRQELDVSDYSDW